MLDKKIINQSVTITFDCNLPENTSKKDLYDFLLTELGLDASFAEDNKLAGIYEAQDIFIDIQQIVFNRKSKSYKEY